MDVFADQPLRGNPVAVVHDADAMDEEEMAALARWTNLSETTFVLRPTRPEADYRLRIFTPRTELPFAGHPTLGTAHAWLEAGGSPTRTGSVVQECAGGLVEVRRGETLAFAAPPLRRGGAVDERTHRQVVRCLGVDPATVRAVEWVDNGPGWLGALLADGDLKVGVLGRCGPGDPADVEVRASAPAHGVAEDPVTGSLNAGLATWLTADGALPPAYVVRQGTALGRDGRVRITTDADGQVWVGGATRTLVSGSVAL